MVTRGSLGGREGEGHAGDAAESRGGLTEDERTEGKDVAEASPSRRRSGVGAAAGAATHTALATAWCNSACLGVGGAAAPK